VTARKTSAPSPNGFGPGTVLADRYQLEERIAGGGMGEVWRAKDLLLERSVAVKLLRESLAEDPVVAERFKREALLAAQLSHPNMAGVYDYVQGGDRPGIVMEFVDGETLAEKLTREGPLSLEATVRIASGMLNALRSAHDAGIVHRDVKPGNVMLASNGDVKVTDFGVARAVSDHTLTETGMVVGTAHYLAPEQVAGEPATPMSDLYSVGAVMYEMLTGNKPFEADTPIAVAMKRLTEDPPSVRAKRKDTPPAVAQVVDRALARDPAARFANATDMREALEAGYAGQPSPAGVTGAVPVPTRPAVVGPTPTDVLPVGEATAAGATVVFNPAAAPALSKPEPRTGEAPAAAVAERRRRDYRRLAIILPLVAIIAAAAVLGVLALTGRGSDLVTVPNFRGLTLAQAEQKARSLGLVVAQREGNSRRAAGRIAGQSIEEGTHVAKGEKITLIVSNGMPPAGAGIQVPNVLGMKQADAERTLTEAGLKVSVQQVQTNATAGTVIGQDPQAGSTAQSGDQVAIFVATAPHRGHGKHKNDEG